jgi:transketolase
MHTVKPLDIEAMVSAARECRGIVTIEEHNVLGGLGGAVAEACLEAGAAPGFFARVGLNDCYPTTVGDQDYLRAAYNIDCNAILARVRVGLGRTS